MAIFNLALSYSNQYFEEFVRIEAKTIKEAKNKCEEIIEKEKNEIVRLSKLNVYKSKIIKSCRLCDSSQKLDKISLSNILKDEI